MKDLLPFVLDVAAKSAGLLCVAWIAAFLARRQAALRHLIWVLALIAILAIPEIELLPSPRPLATWRVPTAWSAAQPALTPASRSFGVESVGAVKRAGAVAGPIHKDSYSLATVGLIVWLSGTMLLLLRSASAMWLLRHRCSRAAVAGVDEPMTAVAKQVAEQCGVRRWELRVSEEAFPPVAMTWGLLRPVVMLPREAREWTERRSRVVLLHEFAHVRRRDYLWHLWAALATAAYWFHPLVWIACSRMRSAAEDAADDFAIRSGIEPHVYADELVTIAGAIGRRRLRVNQGLAIVRTSRLGSRVRAILDPRNRRRPLRFGHLVTSLLACVGALGIAYACRPAGAQEPDDAKTILIPAPKGLVPPLERPELAFLKEMGFGNPVYENDAVENLRSAFDEKFIYPSWQYSIDSPGEVMSRQLKVYLTLEDGWTLSFPNAKRPYVAKGDHVTDGRIDLHIEFFYDDLPWRERSYLVVTDRSVVLEHRLDPHPPTNASSPGDKALGRLAQALGKTKIYAEPKTASQVFYTLAPYEYVVTMPYSAKWTKVLLQNGTFGYALSAMITELPYRVTSSPISLNASTDVSSRALRLVGQPIDRSLRGGGFIRQVFGGTLPESLSGQTEIGQQVTRLENLKPGDRVYFWDEEKGEMGFGGIFVGNGYFVGPLPGHRSIATDYLGQKKWLKSLVAARR